MPERYKHNAHHWLILHGRYVCKARKPECWRCIIDDICLFKPKTPAPTPVDVRSDAGHQFGLDLLATRWESAMRDFAVGLGVVIFDRPVHLSTPTSSSLYDGWFRAVFGQ